MSTIRWASGLIITICLALFWVGVRDWFLVGFTAALILIFLWTFGAFTGWSEHITEDHPAALSRLDRLDGVGNRQEKNQ